MSNKSLPVTRRTALIAAGAGVVTATAGSLSLTTKASAAAPKLGSAVPDHYRFSLGDFEITTLRDGAIQLDGPHPIFGQNIAADEVKAFAEANFLPGTRQEISFTPFVVNTGKELVLFDTGNGAARRPKAGHLAKLLESAGFTTDQVDVVVLTHFHPDHIGGLMEDGKPLFANARYMTGENEFNFWSNKDLLNGGLKRVATLVQSNVVPIAEKTTFLKNEGQVVSGITGLAAFGHTPGHMAFHIESNGKRLVAIGDACNHYVMSVQRPDWHVKFDMDKEKAVAARKSLLGMIAADKVPFTGYHMPFPAVGFLETKDTGFRYVAASYQMNL